MNKINWKQKLTSRKFWAAIAGVATTVMIICNVDRLKQEQVLALISSSGVLIAYIIGEGMVDSARLNNTSNTVKNNVSSEGED